MSDVNIRTAAKQTPKTADLTPFRCNVKTGVTGKFSPFGRKRRCFMSAQNNRSEKTTVYVSVDTLKRCDAGIILTGMRSRSEFFERAVDFYSGYVSAQKHTDFLAKVIVETMEGLVGVTENRLARLMFKEAVELAKLTHMLASINEMDDDVLSRLHYKCVQEVKKINGTVKFEDAVRSLVDGE
jgi:hypothetical protein